MSVHINFDTITKASGKSGAAINVVTTLVKLNRIDLIELAISKGITGRLLHTVWIDYAYQMDHALEQILTCDNNDVVNRIKELMSH